MDRFLRRFFSPDAGPSAGGTADAGNGAGAQNTGGNPQGSNSSQNSTAAPAIDYDKIQNMIDRGTQQKENAILKSYFQQQGLSEAEAKQAMETFKQQKAAQQPDITALQAQLSQAQAAAHEAALEKAVTLEAAGMGMDVKSIPYLLRMADLSQAAGQDGKISPDAIKAAINKVLEDIPALKPRAAQATGFIQVGSTGSAQPAGTVDAELDKIFGIKK